MNKREQERKVAGPSHDEIAARAEELWRERGCPHGQSTEIWLEAEQQLLRGATGRGKMGYGVASEDRPMRLDSDAKRPLEEELDERFPDDTGREPTSL
jgi:hypothetical protein